VFFVVSPSLVVSISWSHAALTSASQVENAWNQVMFACEHEKGTNVCVTRAMHETWQAWYCHFHPVMAIRSLLKLSHSEEISSSLTFCSLEESKSTVKGASALGNQELEWVQPIMFTNGRSRANLLSLPNSFQTKLNMFCHYSLRCTHTSDLRQQTAAHLNNPETDNPWKCWSKSLFLPSKTGRTSVITQVLV